MRLLQRLLAGGLNPRMGGKLLCNRTTGSKPGFLGYHRQTWGEGTMRRRAWTTGQSQLPAPGVYQVLSEKPKATASLGTTCSGCPSPRKSFC